MVQEDAWWPSVMIRFDHNGAIILNGTWANIVNAVLDVGTKTQ